MNSNGAGITDLYGVVLADQAALMANHSLSSDSKTLYIEVTSSTSGSSTTTVQLNNYFGGISYNTAALLNTSGGASAEYANIEDAAGNKWGSVATAIDAFELTDTTLQINTPAIIPTDSAPPRIAATGLPGVVEGPSVNTVTALYEEADAAIFDGNAATGTRVVLAIAHTGVSNTAGTFLINTTGNNTTVGSNDEIWKIGDSTGSSEVEVYQLIIQFNEAIKCSSCTATVSNSTRYTVTASTPTVYGNHTATGTTLVGSSSNTLFVQFQLNNSQSTLDGDYISISGVSDMAGNTQAFTITLAVSGTGGIEVTPTTAIY
jgi:hypothetical protein